VKRNLLIGTPCYGSLLTQVYVQSLVRLMSDVKLLAAPGAVAPGLTLWTHQDSLITRARNSIVTVFLDDPTLTHLMFIDADTGFEPAQIKRMLDFDQEIVAGVHPIKSFDWARIASHANAQQARGEPVSAEQLRIAGLSFVGVPCTGAAREERDGFVTAQYAGTGFMLIRRTAIEKLIAAYPETKYETAHLNQPASGHRYEPRRQS
jgi:hypothetical protein